MSGRRQQVEEYKMEDEDVEMKKTGERDQENGANQQNENLLNKYQKTDKPHETGRPMEAHGPLPKCRDTLQRCAQRLGDGGILKCHIIAVVVVLLVLLVVSVGFNIHQFVAKLMCPPAPRAPPCPQGWVLNGTSCYFFSADESTWNDSRRDCSSPGGSLATLDTPVEKDFIMRSMEKDTYWIGLRRADVDQPWKLPDGSDFTSWFTVGGTGRCAYLNEDTVDSTWCTNLRRWICRRPPDAS